MTLMIYDTLAGWRAASCLNTSLVVRRWTRRQLWCSCVRSSKVSLIFIGRTSYTSTSRSVTPLWLRSCSSLLERFLSLFLLNNSALKSHTFSLSLLYFCYSYCVSFSVLFNGIWPRVGPGTPLPPCPFTSSSFPPFTFLFLSLALPIFFFCPSLSFLPE